MKCPNKTVRFVFNFLVVVKERPGFTEQYGTSVINLMVSVDVKHHVYLRHSLDKYILFSFFLFFLRFLVVFVVVAAVVAAAVVFVTSHLLFTTS